MSYVDLMETILVKKEDVKPSAAAAARLKKAIPNPVVPDESMDTTPVPQPEDSPSSKTMILRPLCNNNSPRLLTYETEPMCSD